MGGRGLDRGGGGEEARQLSVDRDVDDGRALAAQTLTLLIQEAGFDAERCQEVGIAQNNGLAVDLAGGALAGRRVELFDFAQIEISLPAGPHDRVSERMFARALAALRQPQTIA